MAKSRAELEAELARLQSMEQQYKEAMLENERLKQLLNEAEDKQEFSFEYAEVIASSSEDYLCVYTLNQRERRRRGEGHAGHCRGRACG